MRALFVLLVALLAIGQTANALSVSALKHKLTQESTLQAEDEVEVEDEGEEDAESDSESTVGDLVDDKWGSVFYALNKVSEGAGTCKFSTESDLAESAFADKVKAALKWILTKAPKGGKALLSAFDGKKVVFVPSVAVDDAAFSPCVVKFDGTLTADAAKTGEWKAAADLAVGAQGQKQKKAWEDEQWVKFWTTFHTDHGTQATVFVNKDAFSKKHRVPKCAWTKSGLFWKITTPASMADGREDNWANNKIEFHPAITIAHELIHAYHHMNNKMRSKVIDWNAGGNAAIVTVDGAKPNSLSVSFADFPNIEEYNAVLGVTGLTDADGKNVNENTIRAEAGEPHRGCYLPYDQAGSNL